MSDSKKKAAQKRAKEKRLHEVLRDDAALANAISRHATLELLIAGQRLEAEAEIKAITERHTARIEKSTSELAELFDSIEDYARRHRSDLFKADAKSTTINGHEIAFRKGNPTVTTAKSTTQKAVLVALLEHENEAWADGFVRWKESLNKEAMLDQWNAETGEWKADGKGLEDLGVEIEQTERFYLTTSRALSESQVTRGAAEAVA